MHQDMEATGHSNHTSCQRKEMTISKDLTDVIPSTGEGTTLNVAMEVSNKFWVAETAEDTEAGDTLANAPGKRVTAVTRTRRHLVRRLGAATIREACDALP